MKLSNDKQIAEDCHTRAADNEITFGLLGFKYIYLCVYLIII